MRIMRFSSRRGKSGFTLNSILPNPNSTKALLYPIRKGYFSKEHIDIYTLLPWCSLINDENKENQFDAASCQLFQPVFTDLGMCHSFNPAPALNMLKPSYFKANICLTEDTICRIDIVSRCFENKNNNCCETKLCKNAI